MALLDNNTQVSVLVDGLDHPEGIAWGLDGYAYAGGEAGQIYKIDIVKQQFTEIGTTGGFILGIAMDAQCNIYACDARNRAVMKVTQEGKVSTYSTGAPNETFVTPNFPAFDSNGNLYVCDSGEWKSDNGKIFKIHPGGDTEVWQRKQSQFPNGLCLSPDGQSLYVAMSLNAPRVDRISIQPDGAAGSIQNIINLPGTVPDGLAFDTVGNLYVSMYRPDIIYRVSNSSKAEILAEDYQGTLIAAPTNIAFCGQNLDLLLGANIGRWHITKYDVEVTGHPLTYPHI